MTLTLVTGPANSAKAGEVLGAYAAAAGRGAVLVVPTAQDAEHYARELADPTRPAREGAVLGTVLTFDGLFEVIAQRAGYAGRRLSALQAARVLTGVLAGPGFDSLRRSAAGAGFAAAAGDLIAELQRALVDPSRFAGALRAWAAQDVRRASFTRDLGRIYGEYIRELDRLGRVDRELFARRAVDALRAQSVSGAQGGGAAARWGRDAVFVYGFDELTALERDAIETLAAIPGVGVTVSLTYEPGRAALVARAEAVEELRPLSGEVIELPALDDHYAPASRTVLHALERGLFEPGADPVPDPDGVVTLLEAGGERAEAELVAAEVLTLLRGGTPPEQIAVVHRAAARAAPLLARVFAAAGVRLAARHTVPFGHTPLGRAVLGAARCAWLTEPAHRAPKTSRPLATCSPTCAPPGISSGRRSPTSSRPRSPKGGLTTVPQARAALGWELGELESLRVAVGEPGRELCRLAGRLLAAPHRGQGAVLDLAEELDARAFSALARATDELAQLRAIAPGHLAAPRPALLLELLAALPVATGDDGGGRGGGAARRAGADPRPPLPRGVRLRPAGGRVSLPRRGPSRFSPTSVAGSWPRPRGCACARGRRPWTASATCSTRPSRAPPSGSFSPTAPPTRRATSRWPRRSSPTSPRCWTGTRLRARRRRRLLADVTWPLEQAPTEREALRARAAASAPLVGDETVGARWLGAPALGLVRHTRIVSAGALERYGDCPVRWLVESELSPQLLAPDPEAPSRGTVIHALLEQTLTGLGGPVTEATLPRAVTLMREALDAVGRDPSLIRGAQAALGSGRPGGGARGRAALDRSRARALPRLRGGLRARVVGGRPGAALRLRGRRRVAARARARRRRGRDRGPGPDRPHRHRRRRPRDRARLQERLAAPGLAGRSLERRPAAAGRALHARGARAGRTGPGRRRLPAAAGRGSARPRPGLGRSSAKTPPCTRGDVRSPEEVEAELADAAQRAVALARRLRSGELTPCPQTCSRDGCAHPAICRSQ